MTDIVARIRFMRYRGKDDYLNQQRDILHEAADEIERLEQIVAYGVDMRIALAAEKDAEIERLTAVVSAIDEHDPEKPSSWRYRREALCEMARRALENKPEREYDPDVAPCDDAEFGMKP